MKTKVFTPIGSLHPILFFAVMYLVALLFAVFICSSLFYSCNADSSKIGNHATTPVERQLTTVLSVTLR